MFIIDAGDYIGKGKKLPLGRQGENLARYVRYDIRDMVDEFGVGTFQWVNRRPNEVVPYITTNIAWVDDYACWNLTDVDTGNYGEGNCELRYYVDNVLCKTIVWTTVITKSLWEPGETPDPYYDVLDVIADDMAQIKSDVYTAESWATGNRDGQAVGSSDPTYHNNSKYYSQVASTKAEQATNAVETARGVVEDWLDDHIDPQTGYVVDDTLTIAGAAADAKAAGDMIRASFVVGEASGSIASFTDGADGVPVKDLVVNITPKQAGTGNPSPTNVRAITGWTEANINVAGINIWDEEWEHGYYDRASGAKAGNSATNYYRSKNFIPCAPNQLYYVKKPTNHASNSTWMAVLKYDANKNYLSCATISQNTSSVLQTTGVSYLTFYVETAASGATYENDISINYPSTDSEYHAYKGKTYNVSFGSAGTVYGGTLDVTTGMLTITKVRILLDGSINTFSNGSAGIGIWLTNLPYAMSTAERPVYSEYKTITAGSAPSDDYTANWNSVLNAIQIHDSRGMTAAEYNAFTATHPIEMGYLLANPISVQLTATDVRTLLGNNHIWSDTGSVESCEYRADTKLYLEKLTNPDDDMVANANITSGSYFMTGNTLYKATTNIANGATIIPGTNCIRKSLAEALNEINA